jgi:hypothetical protein
VFVTLNVVAPVPITAGISILYSVSFTSTESFAELGAVAAGTHQHFEPRKDP